MPGLLKFKPSASFKSYRFDCIIAVEMNIYISVQK